MVTTQPIHVCLISPQDIVFRAEVFVFRIEAGGFLVNIIYDEYILCRFSCFSFVGGALYTTTALLQSTQRQQSLNTILAVRDKAVSLIAVE